MIANAVFAAAILVLGLFFFLTTQLRFLIPYRSLLLHHYAPTVLLFTAVLFVNLTAALFTLGRRFFLKDTGRKLSHLDKQLHMGATDVPAPWFEEETD